MTAKITSGAVIGIAGHTIEIEVQMGSGLINMFIVGLTESASRETRVRIRSALIENGFKWPQRSITVNLTPANIRKEGTVFDLPIALALLAADGKIPVDEESGSCLPGSFVLGELGLSGEIRPLRGILSLAIAAREQGCTDIIVPRANAVEAALVEGIRVRPADHLTDVIEYAQGHQELPVFAPDPSSPIPDPDGFDLADVRGQQHAKRALEIAAAGGHSILFVGPPGAGKTMLARRLPSILPELSFEEALEVTAIHSVAGLLPGSRVVTSRPFRAPHHTISNVGLIGSGGSPSPKPGEVSLAHHGVLFLDELPEFSRSALEALQRPLKDRSVRITRRQTTVQYPAHVMLVASMSNCPCGFFGSGQRSCQCSAGQRERYWARHAETSFDLCVELKGWSYESLKRTPRGERSETIRRRVSAARRQLGAPSAYTDKTRAVAETIARLDGVSVEESLHEARELTQRR